jgi:WD40 repeat protein
MRALIWLAISAVAGAQSLPGDRAITSDSQVGALSFSADGTLIAATCDDRKIRSWDSRTGELKQSVPVDTRSPAPIPQSRPLVFSPDRKFMAGATRATDGSENTVHIWDASGTERLALQAGLGGISTMAFSPDGGTLVATGYDTNLRAWSTRDGELLRLMEELPLAMFASAFSPDGKYLATAGADRIVYLWDTGTWKIARRLSGQPEMISAMAFSPDGRLLLTGGFSEYTQQNPVKAVLWDVSSGKPLRSMPSAHMVRAAAFSPDGTRVATATIGQTISIWAVPSVSTATRP